MKLVDLMLLASTGAIFKYEDGEVTNRVTGGTSHLITSYLPKSRLVLISHEQRDIEESDWINLKEGLRRCC